MNKDLRILTKDIKARFNPLCDLVYNLSGSTYESLSAKELCDKVLDAYVCLSDNNMFSPLAVDSPESFFEVDEVTKNVKKAVPEYQSVSVSTPVALEISDAPVWYDMTTLKQQGSLCFALQYDTFIFKNFAIATPVFHFKKSSSGVSCIVSLQPVENKHSPIINSMSFGEWGATWVKDDDTYYGRSLNTQLLATALSKGGFLLVKPTLGFSQKNTHYSYSFAKNVVTI